MLSVFYRDLLEKTLKREYYVKAKKETQLCMHMGHTVM